MTSPSPPWASEKAQSIFINKLTNQDKKKQIKAYKIISAVG